MEENRFFSASIICRRLIKMYFPYVRGRQYELLALKELVSGGLLSDKIIPIVEPVKLSPTLINTMDEFIKKNHSIAILRNPEVGSFLSDWEDAVEGSREAGFIKKFENMYTQDSIVKSAIMQSGVKFLLDAWKKKRISNNQMLIVCKDRDYLPVYEERFLQDYPKYTLIPDESAFRRKIKKNRVLVDDRFEKQERNSDYSKKTDEYFSDDHIYFADDGYVGFSDYSIVGDDYMEAGFAPYAVAIHIVYFATDGSLHVKHFVSDSNEDITNPALKYYEAVSKLATWYKDNESSVPHTAGLKVFLKHYEEQSYPGLGTVKKLSLMHHIELMGKYLDEEK